MLKPLLGFDFGWFPIYQIMIGIALLAGLITLNKAFKNTIYSKYMRKRIRKSFFYASIFGMIGANIANWFLFEHALDYSLHYRITKGGYTFYFGMLCFFAVAALLLRLYKTDVGYCLNMIVPSVLIAQFFGRLGCSLRGCCYGRTISILGLSFAFPARELEAIFVLILFFILLKRCFGKRLQIYLFSYSIFRFVMEFLRGDNRGTLFGITALSPTQVIAIIVIVISAITLFSRPILKLFKKEEALDHLKESLREFFFRKKYEPLPCEYPGPIKKKRALKIVVAIMLAITIPVFALIYINPLQMTWCDNVRFAVNEAFSFVFEGRGTETEIGVANGVSLVDVSDQGKVTDQQAALVIVKNIDKWNEFEYAGVEPVTLANGNQMYKFNQTVNGKIVLGKTRVLVADKENNALYIIGDEATFTYSNEVLPTYAEHTPTVQEAFGAGVTILERMDCYYDTGNGLVDAYHAILTDDGVTPIIGVVVQASNNRIICYTQPICGVLSTFERNSITTGSENVLELLEEKDNGELEELSKKQKDVAELEQEQKTIERALSLAYKKSKLSHKEFAKVIESANEVAEGVPELNKIVYREIVVEETRQLLLNDGESERSADKCAKKVERAFETCKVKQDEDEVASNITAEERKSTFKHSIDYDYDVDVYDLVGEPEKGISITLKTKEPINAEIYGKNGRAIVSMYVDDEESILLYPEDGSEFVVKVKDQKTSIEPSTKSSDYRLTIQSIDVEDEIPRAVNTIITRVQDSYARSNVTSFASMCALDGKKVGLEEALAVGFMAPMLDSCASCVGLEDGLDSAKTTIAGALIPNIVDYDNLGNSEAENIQDMETFMNLQYLRGSEMELSYFHHIETETGIALKLKLIIKMNGMDIYNGFTFLKIEHLDEDTDMSEDEQIVSTIFSFFTDANYYITQINTDELYATFGDTADNIKSTTDLTSLYELWQDKEYASNGIYLSMKTFDENVALQQGHGQDKVKGFKEYTIRHNLMNAKSTRVTYQIELEMSLCISKLGEPIVAIYNAITDPWGTLGDELFGQNEVTNTIWNIAKFVTDPVGTVTDELVDAMLDDVFQYAENCAEQAALKVSILDGIVKELKEQLNALAYIPNIKKRSDYYCLGFSFAHIYLETYG